MSDSQMARLVQVAPERLAGWLERFATRHGAPVVTSSPQVVRLDAPDGAVASVELPWGALPGRDPIAELIADAERPRLVGALIVRRRAHAVGIFDGPDLVIGRHAGHYVQGRTKAGGWSQQRYARRRANQAGHAFAEAAADVAELLLPEAGRLEALVAGGDATAVAEVLARSDFEPLRRLRVGPVHATPDPNATILAGFGQQLRQVRIRLNEQA
jgi:Peptide chain release factor 1 (eRF1)